MTFYRFIDQMVCFRTGQRKKAYPVSSENCNALVWRQRLKKRRQEYGGRHSVHDEEVKLGWDARLLITWSHAGCAKKHGGDESQFLCGLNAKLPRFTSRLFDSPFGCPSQNLICRGLDGLTELVAI